MAIDTSSFSATARSLFRRCVQCPSTVPSCPSCGSDENCQLSSLSCDACPSTTCVKIGALPGQLATSPKTPIGPIIGGVVAGVIALAVMAFLLYWFCIRPRRQAMQAWDPPEKRDQTTLHADRQSTRSVASTVLTRASNVIQIAYIPGVTVRSPPDSPGILPPPIPSFPGASLSSSAASTPAVEQHFFMPSDLRASTWSDASSVDPRISVAPSLARTTLYGDGAVIAPVQQAARGHANMVSVKHGSTTPSGPSSLRTPPVPQMPKLGNSGSSIVAKNVRAAPIEIKKNGSGQRVPTLGNLAKQASNKKTDSTNASEKSVAVFLDEKEVVSTPSESRADSPISPFVRPKPSFASGTSARSSSVSAILPADGPLGNGNTTTHRHSKSEGLNAMIEEAINRARDPHMSVRPEVKRYDSGPFSDANEVKENSV